MYLVKEVKVLKKIAGAKISKMPGDIIKVSDKQARELVKAGIVEYTDQPLKQKEKKKLPKKEPVPQTLSHSSQSRKTSVIIIPSSLIHYLEGLGPHFCMVEKKGKNPSVGGKEWQKRPLAHNDPKLQAWLQQGGNYGVIGGWGLVIVDVDSHELKMAAKDKLPETFTVESPGSHGWHLYYLCNLENPIRLRDKNHDNIGDIQGPGKQVVGPNCIHPNGGIYKVINDKPLAQTTPEDLKTAFKTYIVADKVVRESIQKAEISKFQIPITKVIDLSGFYLQGSEYYGPHPTHGSSTGRNFWVNPDKNCWHCFRHDSGGGSLSLLAVLKGIIQCEEAVSEGLTGAKFHKVLELAVERGFLEEEQIKTTPQNYFQTNKDTGRVTFVPKLLAEAIMGKYTFKTRRDSEEVYVYDKGFYKPHGFSYIKQECAFELSTQYRRHYTIEVTDYIRATSYAEFVEPPEKYVNVENGILNLKTKQLEPHNPDYMFFNKLPVQYDKTAICPSIDQFLEEVAETQKERRALIEFIGYCLYRKYLFHKALMLIGTGANGKTTYLNLVKTFIGEKNYATRSLQELERDRFASSDLFGKLANICGDLPSAQLKNTGTFKQLVGGDTLSAQKKNLPAFKFQNYAKLLFSTNKPPEPRHDKSFAFFRRWVLVTFPKIFIGSNCNPVLLDKITEQEELSGLLNKAVDHLQTLLINGGFTTTDTVEDVKKRYMRKANNVQAFADDILLEDEDGWISNNEIFKAYTRYCGKHGLDSEGRYKFYNQLEKLEECAAHRKRANNIRGFAGVSFIMPTMPEKKTHTLEEFRGGVNISKEEKKFHGKVGKTFTIGEKCTRCGNILDPKDPDVKSSVDGAGRVQYYHVACKSVVTKDE